MDKRIQTEKPLTKVERKRIKLVGWLCIITFLCLCWLGGCKESKHGPRKGQSYSEWRVEEDSKLIRVNETGDPFGEGSYYIHEFTYKGHHYIGFPTYHTYGGYALSVVHDPDCTNEKCINLNK